MIKITGLTKRYKKLLAVDKVSLEVPSGSVFGLIGLNGAGKTTILKSITGLIKSFTGSISVNGRKWGSPYYKKSFVFVPERFTPQHFLTGWEFVTYMNSMHGEIPQRQRVLDLCHRLGFDVDKLSKRCRTYSNGTAQKLGLIQALSVSAPLLIFDEPMSGLDPLVRMQLKTAFFEEHKAGRTILLSTHLLHDVDTMCTNLGIIDNGKLLYSGTPEALKSSHTSGELERAFLTTIKTEFI